MKNKIYNNIVYIFSIIIAFIIIFFGFFYPKKLNVLSGKILNFVSINFGWFYILLVFAIILFLVYLSFSKYGKIKLGKPNDKKEFSDFSWYSMLFCGGTGIGLVFWSFAEPISHYINPPAGISSMSLESLNFSIRTSFLHWGITQWACFAIVGLCIAYFSYNKNKKNLISETLSPIFGENVSNKITGKIIDTFSVVVSYAGIATSLGLGIMQITGGLNYLFKTPQNNITYFIIIAIIAIIFTASSLSGVEKGIKKLSNFNTILALSLLTLIFIVGPKIEILNTLVNGVGQHIQYFFKDCLMINVFEDNTWYINWRVFYYAWFIAWTPFVGMFVAKISKGRTIREFIFGVVLIPTLFTIIWISVLGTTGLHVANSLDASTLENLIGHPETAIFTIMGNYPLVKIISFITILLLGTFFITSADSATYSLGLMTDDLKGKQFKIKQISWAVIVSLIAYVLLISGGLKPLQTISIAASLPFMFIIILMISSLIIDIKKR